MAPRRPSGPPKLTVVSNEPKRRSTKAPETGGGGGKGGRPPHTPTKSLRGLVSIVKAFNVSNVVIAKKMEIGVSTLEKHYAEELATGREEVVANVGVALYQTAVDRGHPKHATAAIFLLKTIGGFRDSGTIGDPDEDGEGGELIVVRANIGAPGKKHAST